MPVKELISAMPDVPENVRQAADGLVYRDYLIVAILLKEFLLNEKAKVKDNWIYLQERDMTAGRLMDVNNFSMKMLDDESHFLLGVEYFCTEGDMVWSMDDGEIGKFSVSELAAAGIIRPEDVIKTKIFRQTKAYPAYFGTYSRFGEIRSYLDGFGNLFLAGRNGMHRYNNMDHSVLAGLTAADLIISGSKDKASLWDINTEEEYHEEKKK
jgi:protoporphyrinogen oxidase